jgi:hypothetical protein
MNVIAAINPLVTANLPYLHFEKLTLQDQHFVAKISSQQPTSNCPSCAKPSHQVHSHYQRRLQELPISGQAVCWHIRVRRFRCATKRCKQGIFCERFAKEIVVYARSTLRNTKILEQAALLFGAKPSVRLTLHLGFQSSAATLLGHIHQFALPANTEPLKVIGVDDFAFKKGRVYGTIIVNHENHHVVDILPDRSSQTLIDWLQQHPIARVPALECRPCRNTFDSWNTPDFACCFGWFDPAPQPSCPVSPRLGDAGSGCGTAFFGWSWVVCGLQKVGVVSIFLQWTRGELWQKIRCA